MTQDDIRVLYRAADLCSLVYGADNPATKLLREAGREATEESLFSERQTVLALALEPDSD